MRRNLSVIADRIEGPTTERALVEISMEGAAESAKITPVDSSFLVNSLMNAPRITQQTDGMQAMIGYTAEYAAAVHGMPGKLKGLPREHFGRTAAGVAFGGGSGTGRYWDPHGEPQFLTKGFDKILPDLPALLRALYAV